MAVGTVSSSTVDNWQLIATNSPTSGTTSTFSGLSGYKRYLVVFNGVTISANGILCLQFNGNTSNYFGGGLGNNSTGGNASQGLTSKLMMGAAAQDNLFNGHIFIENLLSGPKIANGFMFTGNAQNLGALVNGGWNDTSAVTSIVIGMNSSQTFSAGTISLYGIAA